MHIKPESAQTTEIILCYSYLSLSSKIDNGPWVAKFVKPFCQSYLDRQKAPKLNKKSIKSTPGIKL